MCAAVAPAAHRILRKPRPSLRHRAFSINREGVNEVTTLSEKLSQSQILRDYEAAFADATGLPLEFRLPGKKRPGIRNKKNANPFCTQLSETDPGCKMCVDMQERLTDPDVAGTRSGFCAAG